MEIRRTQAERRGQTQRALLSAARTLFAERGFAATSTPEIVAAAAVTRGALYHHFADKTALFAAVLEEEHLLVAMSMNAAAEANAEPGPIKALISACDAFLDALQNPGRQRIMLVDAPAVLGRAAVDEIDARYGQAALIRALQDAINAGAIKKQPIEPLAHLLGALFDRAALAAPAELGDYRKSIKALIRGLKS